MLELYVQINEDMNELLEYMNIAAKPQILNHQKSIAKRQFDNVYELASEIEDFFTEI